MRQRGNAGHSGRWRSIRPRKRCRRTSLSIDIRGDAAAAMVSIEQLRGWAPPACIIAVADEADPNSILRAMRAGVNEFLVWPPSDEPFNEAIRHAAVAPRAVARKRADRQDHGVLWRQGRGGHDDRRR